MSKAKMGRPSKEMDWHLLDSLVTVDASLNYCAERQLVKWGEQVSRKTIKAAREVIERRVKQRFDCTFTEYKQQKIEPIYIRLKQKQIEVALSGNVTMLIWLGKQYLGQSEKVESKGSMVNTQVGVKSDEELDARLAELLKGKETKE